MRKQYHFWRGEHGRDAWDVDRLVALSADFPVIEVEVAAIPDIDTPYWFDEDDPAPTVRNIAEHVRLIEEVDVEYPIILGPENRVLDGMHRIVRALLEGRSTIRAVQFDELPEPDFRNCRPDELPYD